MRFFRRPSNATVLSDVRDALDGDSVVARTRVADAVYDDVAIWLAAQRRTAKVPDDLAAKSVAEARRRYAQPHADRRRLPTTDELRALLDEPRTV
jgi:hypothetical protein